MANYYMVDRNLIIVSLGLQKMTASLRFDLTLFLCSFMELLCHLKVSWSFHFSSAIGFVNTAKLVKELEDSSISSLLTNDPAI